MFICLWVLNRNISSHLVRSPFYYTLVGKCVFTRGYDWSVQWQKNCSWQNGRYSHQFCMLCTSIACTDSPLSCLNSLFAAETYSSIHSQLWILDENMHVLQPGTTQWDLLGRLNDIIKKSLKIKLKISSSIFTWTWWIEWRQASQAWLGVKH